MLLHARDRRPFLGQLGIQLDEDLLILRHVLLGHDGIDRALGDADRAIDAFIGIDGEEVGAFTETVDGADIDTIGVSAANTVFGYDVRHDGPSPWHADVRKAKGVFRRF